MIIIRNPQIKIIITIILLIILIGLVQCLILKEKNNILNCYIGESHSICHSHTNGFLSFIGGGQPKLLC